MVPKPKKPTKYLYGWKLWVNYGDGWEYEQFESTYKGYQENRRLYAENCPYPTKWRQGRELNPDYLPQSKEGKL